MSLIATKENEREVRASLDKAFKAGELAIVNGWLVELVDQHTCAGGTVESSGIHEPGCGMLPLVDLVKVEVGSIAEMLDRDYPKPPAFEDLIEDWHDDREGKE